VKKSIGDINLKNKRQRKKEKKRKSAKSLKGENHLLQAI